MMGREELRRTLQRLLEEEMGEEYALSGDDVNLREGLNLDSVDIVGVVMRIEREFHIRLASTELEPIATVGDLLDLLDTKLRAPAGPGVAEVPGAAAA